MKEGVICQAIQRSVQNNKIDYAEAVIGEKVIEDRPFKRIDIDCRKKYKLLTYV